MVTTGDSSDFTFRAFSAASTVAWLTPIGGEDKIFGRVGLLAHTYMLGPNGDSNGCVSFKDYYAFLNAYRNHGIRRLAVLAKVE